MSDRRTTKLSKNLRQMKFMQRSGVQKLDDDEQSKKLVSKEHWYLPESLLPDEQAREVPFVEESSICNVMGVNFTRFSFNGANPLVERLSAEMATEKEEKKSEKLEKEMGISDEEMARRMGSLKATIAKKFSKKRHMKDDSSDVKTKVKKFLKPSYD